MTKDQLNEGFYEAWNSKPMDEIGKKVSEFIETISGWEDNKYLNNCHHWANFIESKGGPDNVFPMALGFVTGAWEFFIKEYEESVQQPDLEDAGLEGC